MLSSSATTDGECNCNCNRKNLKRGSSSSSARLPSSTTSSTPSSFAPSFSYLHQTPRSNNAMEDVWKDINLASLTDHSTSRPMTSNSTFRFQDFLTAPFTIAIDPPTSTISSASKTSSLHCPASAFASLPPPPVTALSLNSGPGFHFDPVRHKDLQLVKPHHHPAASKVVDPFSNPLQSVAYSSNSFSSFGNKRFLESDSNSGERRNQRMMKNRESAGRSRARKQAYTFELQQKVKHLMEENARLKRQHQQLCQTVANQQKKKSNLRRTFTAPF